MRWWLASEALSVLFGRGEVRAAGSADDFFRKLHSVLGAFLQIKNLSLLLGAGVC
jgi:hypothetical protein